MSKKQIIAFLDASTVELGDVDNSSLRKLGHYRIFPLTQPGQVLRHARHAEVVITNKCKLDGRHFRQLPKLKLICVAATGVNNIDLEAAERSGIAVTNVRGYSTTTVAEHTMMLVLALSHRLLEHHAWSVNGSLKGSWSRSPHFALLDFPYSDLAGKTLGIIGYGAIGRKVAKLARSFGMNISIAKLPGRSYPKVPKRSTLRDTLRTSDFVTLHCPLTQATHNLINKEKIRWMKRSTCLLNLARGPIVAEKDVAHALLTSKIRAYAGDVLAEEPPPSDHPLFDSRLRDKVIFTPHVAWASRESRQRLLNEIAENIRAFQKGRKRNRIL